MAAVSSFKGIPPMIVTKKLKPLWFHKTIEKCRLECGVQGAYEPKTASSVLRCIKKGGTVGFILDQYAGPPVSVCVPFFGVSVGTSLGLATLVKRTGAPVISAVNYRTKEGRYVIEIGPEIPWIDHPDFDTEMALNTAAYASVLEKHILRFPEQWLWTHRRFKGVVEY